MGIRHIAAMILLSFYSFTPAFSADCQRLHKLAQEGELSTDDRKEFLFCVANNEIFFESHSNDRKYGLAGGITSESMRQHSLN